MVARTTVLPEGVGYTYDELVEQFGSEPDGKRYELFQGALVVSPSPTLRHQEILMNLVELLRGQAKSAGGVLVCAPFDVLLAADEVLIPDLIYVSPQHRGRVSERRLQGAPDLAIEILSPSTAKRDRGAKRASYAAHGTAEYWIVDPETRTVERYLLSDGVLALQTTLAVGDTLRSSLLPSLELAVVEIFG